MTPMKPDRWAHVTVIAFQLMGDGKTETLEELIADAVTKAQADMVLVCARAICGECAHGDMPLRDGDLWLHSHVELGIENPCLAGPIYTKVEAL